MDDAVLDGDVGRRDLGPFLRFALAVIDVKPGSPSFSQVVHTERSSRALVAALWPLTVGHLLAMLVVILPFSLLVALVQWQRDPDRCRPPGPRVRCLPARQP